MVNYNNSMIYGSIGDQITEGEHGPPLKQYLMDKFVWNEAVFDSIDWDAIKTHMNNILPTTATNLIKLAMDWKNDNHQNELFYGKSHICPACCVQEEDHMHFVCCQDPILFRLNTTAVNKLIQAMQKMRTAGLISTVFQSIIGALRQEKEPVEPDWKSDEMGKLGARAWKEQSAIGWHHLLKGRLSRV